MPRVAQYQILQFAGFPLGLNNHVDSSRLEDGELARSINFRLSSRGEMQMRSGYDRFDTNLTNEIRFMSSFRSQTPSDHIIVVDDTGQIFHDMFDGSFANSGKNTNPFTPFFQQYGVGFASANGAIYVTGKDISDTVKFDGTIWTDVPSIDASKELLFRHNRMFAINQNATTSRIQFSEFLQPEVFAPEDWIEADPDDGYQINAATVFGDDLILFKDKSIFKLSGRTPESFALYKVDTHRGSVSPLSVSQLRGLLVFFDRDTGIWGFNGASFDQLSEKINDHILAGQDYDKAHLVTSYVGVDRIYMSIPWSTGGHRTFVFYADTQGWVEYDTGFNDAMTYLGDRYQGHPGAPGVYVGSATSTVHPPDVTPLVGKFRTPWVRVGGPGMKSRVRRIEMTIKADEGVMFTVRMFRDFDEETPYVERTFEGGSVPYLPVPVSMEERVVASDGWGNRIHAFQFEIEVNQIPFQLNDMTVFYTGGIDVRGER